MTYDVLELTSDLAELGGAGIQIVELDGQQPASGAGVVRVGIDRAGTCPDAELDSFDVLLSSNRVAPRPWVGLDIAHLDASIDRLRAVVASQPLASATVAQVLRMTLDVSFENALTLESMAYSMLLASGPFRTWRAATPVRDRDDDAPRVSIALESAGIHIRLCRPAARNAFDARMRDELVEALSFAMEHLDRPRVVLSAEGPAFSAGGDLDKFGQARDVGIAHLIRTLQSPALLVRRLGDRVHSRLHGACVGAGIEIPAAAAWITARADTVFRLPEVSMGLIPGAGGTATLARRIGRQRTCYMALTGETIDLATAMDWGLVDAVEP